MATAVEGKAAEHVMKSLETADTELTALRAQRAGLQTELDALRAVNQAQQGQLMELQHTKLALADAEAKVESFCVKESAEAGQRRAMQ